jgi:phospholipase/carboxylesterase
VTASGDGKVRALIFLHGHDDDADRWVTAATAMTPTGWVLDRPTGPVPTGAGRAAWFETGEHGQIDPSAGRAALDAVASHVSATAGRLGVTSAEVALVGFSQGAAVALLHALTPGTEPLAATVAIAGWLPEIDGWSPALDGPVGRLLIAHGADDEVVPLPLGRSVARLLDRQGHDVTFVEREVSHEPDPFAEDIRTWLTARN